MEPNAFVAEVYRRMSLRYARELPRPSWEQIKNGATVRQAMVDYRALLPGDKNAAIIDIGLGDGWFLAACVNLGYTNLTGADFGVEHKSNVRNWSPSIVALHNIDSNIADFLAAHRAEYDFIHLSHVIEHIPKYSLLDLVDSMYAALKRDGVLLLRTPNMEGPCASSSYFVTLAHEYGFSGSNLFSLLSICNFEDVRFHTFHPRIHSVKQMIGAMLRWPFLRWNAFRHRLFGVNYGGMFGPELVVTGRRGERPPFMRTARP